MSDLDDLATAASGAPIPRPGYQQLPPHTVEYRPQPSSGISVWLWVGLAAGILFILFGGFLIVYLMVGRAAPTPVAQPVAAAPQITIPDLAVPAPADPSVTPKPSVKSPPAQPVSPAVRAAKNRPALQEIADPKRAVEILSLKRGIGDLIEVKARNRTAKGLLVKSIDLFAESDPKTPLYNIGLWIPAGDGVAAAYEIPELSRRLGPDEKITATIIDAEYRDAPPADVNERDRDAQLREGGLQ
jgi:hypothetical protein